RWIFATLESRVRGNCVHRFANFGRLDLFYAFTRGLWPDVKAAVAQGADIPCSPNSFTLAKPSIRNRMSADVGLAPRTLAILDAVGPFDYKRSNIIVAGPGNRAIGKGELQIHPVPVSRPVVVETRPFSRWEICVTHDLS